MNVIELDKSRHNSLWTQSEEDKIYEYIDKGYSYKKIARLLRRSVAAICNKWNLMNKPGTEDGKGVLKHEIYNYNILPGQLYEIRERSGVKGRAALMNRKARCIDNYDNFILFDIGSGVLESYMKVDFMTRRYTIKKLGG